MGRPKQEDKHLIAFGKRIAALRHEKGMTQEELADKTGLAIDSIGAIEQGRRWARLTTLHLLAKGLGIKPEELLKDLK